jgi:hypothetical protein
MGIQLIIARRTVKAGEALADEEFGESRRPVGALGAE